MRFSKYILAIILITSTVLAYGQKADSNKMFTLQQCLDIAIKNNLQNVIEKTKLVYKKLISEKPSYLVSLPIKLI